MRRCLSVVLVLVLGAALWPATSALAREVTADQADDPPSVLADFDNDGVDDLAIGVSGETVAGQDAAGAINVLYGSAGSGLSGTGSQLFHQDTPGVPGTAESFDFFGDALAPGDFNGDGFADLAVGAPGESVGTLAFAGAVNVLYGSPSGLTATGSQLFTQDSAGIGSSAEEFDDFGVALAAGDFDADGVDDLAIGADGEVVAGMFSAGAINTLYGSPGGLTGTGSQLFHQNIAGVPDTAEQTDLFGFALAAGDFDADAADDLAIGVPGETLADGVPFAGAVNVLYGSAGAGIVVAGSQIFDQDSPGVGSSVEEFDEFGFALATGDFDADADDDLAVGVPFETVTGFVAGAINVLDGSPGAGLGGAGSQLIHQNTAGVGSNPENNDAFGFALAAGDFDADDADDLAVGAPFEIAGGQDFAGALNVLFGTAGGGLTGTGSQLFTQNVAGVGSSTEPFDEFGFALATGDFDADGAADLGVGVPGESVGGFDGAGAANVLYGAPGGALSGAGSQLFHQNVAGIGSSAELFDNFGVSLGAVVTGANGRSGASATSAGGASAGSAGSAPARAAG